ncbi:MAG TPA: TauD/TfdA family dioxygenase [Ilumatobacteraceae bacterium]
MAVSVATTRWLLDNCPCPRCLHPITRERTVTLVDQPGIEPISVMSDESGAITVDWGGGHIGNFASDMLQARDDLALDRRPLAPLQRMNYSELESDTGVARWLSAMLTNGAIVLDDTPNSSGEVVRLAERIGYARPTNFGTIFDVESRPDPNNSAYTAAGLDLHTDLPNWASPPDFQFLHALANDATGGDSTVADGVAIAEQLRATCPDAYELLSTTSVPFRFHDTTDDIRHSAPIIEVDADEQPIGIRFNNWIRDADIFADERFYDAYLVLWHMLRDPDNVIAFRLAAGDTVCFDNRRILHGRTPFDPQSGRRHLQGCYVDRDMVESRLRRLSLG